MLYPICSLILEVEPKKRRAVEHVLLMLWPHHEGRGLREVTGNLQLAVDAEIKRLKQVSQSNSTAAEYLLELNNWTEGLIGIREVMDELDKNHTPDSASNKSPKKVKEDPDPDPDKHPLLGYGFTNNPLYSSACNQYEATDYKNEADKAAAVVQYRQLQWWWMRAHSRVMLDFRIDWHQYVKYIVLAAPESNEKDKDKKNAISLNLIEDISGISFQAVGRALRRISVNRHREFLAAAAECCLDDIKQGLREFRSLDDRFIDWMSTDAGIQKERQAFVDSFRLVSEKVLDHEKIRDPQNRKGGSGGGTRNGQSNAGYLGKNETIRHSKPPEDLLEFSTWITDDEVIGNPDKDDIEEDDGVEAPRHTGLKLVHPDDLRGHMARAKAQSHHLAMVRQGFPWDHNTLSPSERQVMLKLVAEVCLPLTSPVPKSWWPKAMVATAWVCGRSLEETKTLACLTQDEIGKVEDNLFAVVEMSSVFYWRWPLRLPNRVEADNFTNGVPRVNFILIPDGSGLAAALIRAHQMRQVAGTQVFGWLKKPADRIAKAIEVTKTLQGDVLDRTIQPALLERDLRITLLNLSPDKTVAWMLAGVKADAREPRMFYASHTPGELTTWAMRAHERMGIHGFAQKDLPKGWPESFAGAKFLPNIVAVRRVAFRARELACNHPPADLLAKPIAVKNPVKKKAGSTSAKQVNVDNGVAKATATSPWNEVKRWRQWHDDVVFWVWLVQALQTSQRATRFPVTLYQQWLKNRKRTWVSLEDKQTADRDESRSSVMTPLLSGAFKLLNQVQSMYYDRWFEKPKEPKKPKKVQEVEKPDDTESKKKPVPVPVPDNMPYGFMVFGDTDRPADLAPAWIQKHLKSEFGENWPVNFNRAMLRRGLSEQGMDGDGLDAVLGHGSMADRIHDRHSMFDVDAHHKALLVALKQWAKKVNLNELKLPEKFKPDEKKEKTHGNRALKIFKYKAKADANKVRRQRIEDDPLDIDFKRWREFVAQLLKKRNDLRYLDDLSLWHERLTESKLMFADYLLGVPCELEIQVGPYQLECLTALQESHKKLAAELESKVVGWVANGEMGRNVAAHGMNLSYLLCKALDSRMPTMKVAMTAHARVSPFTTERIGRAGSADGWRVNCLERLKEERLQPSQYPLVSDLAAQEEFDLRRSQEQARIKLSLCSFLNMTAAAERWRSCVETLVQTTQGRQHVFDTGYEYRVNGLASRTRDCRGFLDAVTTHAGPWPALVETDPSRARELYLALRPQSAKVAADLGQWVQGIRWYGHMHLPPLIASHLEGSLNDQSSQGPLASALGWMDPALPVKALNGTRFPIESDSDEHEVLPRVLLDSETSEMPFGWLPDLPNANTDAGVWLREFIFSDIGGSSDANTLEDLSDALLDALDQTERKHRRKVVGLIAKLRKHHGLEADDRVNSRADQVDRQVVDFATYRKLLDIVELSRIESRMPERVVRMRLLIVLAFRFGMRRREILGLRAGDVDLHGVGRIHIRPYARHTLKTGFSKRSLPILPLLDDQEREWLVQACEEANAQQHPDDAGKTLLIPEQEHDTLARDAIKLLRKAGMDSTLKLHHLRHSFASWMALKIVFARRPEWAEVFAGHPDIHHEMLRSPALVGTILKPQLSAGDFLVIPRMLGHSSYEVTLTNYVHTLDLVATLFVNHELSHQIVPHRDLTDLVNQRYENAIQLRRGSVAGYVPGPSVTADKDVAESAPKPLSTQLKERLLALKVQSDIDNAEISDSEPFSIDPIQLQNWHSPRHAFELRDLLLTGLDRLNPADAALLVNLGQMYWTENPPMFLFSQKRADDFHKNDGSKPIADMPASGPSNVQHDVTELLRILRQMGLTDDQVFFWRYAKAPADAHGRIWDEAVATHGFELQYHPVGGSSKAADSLGVTLGMNQARRSPLPGTLWKALGLVLNSEREGELVAEIRLTEA